MTTSARGSGRKSGRVVIGVHDSRKATGRRTAGQADRDAAEITPSVRLAARPPDRRILVFVRRRTRCMRMSRRFHRVRVLVVRFVRFTAFMVMARLAVLNLGLGRRRGDPGGMLE